MSDQGGSTRSARISESVVASRIPRNLDAESILRIGRPRGVGIRLRAHVEGAQRRIGNRDLSIPDHFARDDPCCHVALGHRRCCQRCSVGRRRRSAAYGYARVKSLLRLAVFHTALADRIRSGWPIGAQGGPQEQGDFPRRIVRLRPSGTPLVDIAPACGVGIGSLEITDAEEAKGHAERWWHRSRADSWVDKATGNFSCPTAARAEPSSPSP